MDGVVAMGDDLTVDTLLEAYSFGIFPWPHPDLPCLWFCPDERGVLDFKDLHIGRSLDKFLRRHGADYEITFNRAFSDVMGECARVPRPGQSGTWITPEIMHTYREFHKLGYAHSVECWSNRELVGGLYGVYVAGVFSGESMFFKKDNASKLCLMRLVAELSKNGLTWMDIQMVTGVTSQLGGRYIAKTEYLDRLKAAKRKARPLHLPAV